tara:strand:+ start:743 stop:1123 length:381 start_codon:yes stop_codon:yes gene_type:complete
MELIVENSNTITNTTNQIDNDNEIENVIENNSKIHFEELDKLRKKIELLPNIHHIEIAKILKNNNIKLTENNNGIFINLNNIDLKIIEEIKEYIIFIKSQEELIDIDESKKHKLEKNFFTVTPNEI